VSEEAVELVRRAVIAEFAVRFALRGGKLACIRAFLWQTYALEAVGLAQ
jgi:hypothetical protein